MISFAKTIRARYYILKADRYNLFPEGKALAKLRNIHEGRRCFIIGNGPSLKADDLNLLNDKKEITFAFNRIYHIFSQTAWRPTYYISQDDRMLRSSVTEVDKVPAKKKFIPAEYKWYYGIDVKDATYFHLKNRLNPETPVFSERVDKCIYNSNTVVISAIQIAIYMGIKEIYFVGVDHHFHTSINSRGEIIVDSTAKDYFSDEYNKDKHDLYIPNLDRSTRDFIAVKKFAEDHLVCIYNSTRGGDLEVFDRIGFDTLF